MAKEIKRLLPNEDLIYFGDTKHLPYGERIEGSYRRIFYQNHQLLLEQKIVKLLL